MEFKNLQVAINLTAISSPSYVQTLVSFVLEFNEEQESARHTKHNTRAHQRDTCNNSRIAAVSPTRF
jgi:hypothetical protein